MARPPENTAESGFWDLRQHNPARRRASIAVGVIATLLVHLAAAVAAPRLTVPLKDLHRALSAESLPGEEDLPRELLIQLAEAPPPTYLETNPDAPVNIPDFARHYSSRDQQSASEKLVDAPSDDPFVEGEDVPSQKIVQGQRPTESEFLEPQPMLPPDFERPGIEFRDTPPSEEDRPEQIARDGEGLDREVAETPPQAGPQAPLFPSRDQQQQPRPRITSQATPGIVQQRTGGTQRLGLTAMNARFSEFGEYQRRMWEAIVLQWYRLAEGAGLSLVFPSEVNLTFRIDQEGNVIFLEVHASNAGTIGTLIVRDAIQGRSPFGPFTDEMRRALNRQEEFRATFRYVY
jgi:hypothetical protein